MPGKQALPPLPLQWLRKSPQAANLPVPVFWRENRAVLEKKISASLESVAHFVSTCLKREGCDTVRQPSNIALWRVILLHWPQLPNYAIPSACWCQELDASIRSQPATQQNARFLPRWRQKKQEIGHFAALVLLSSAPVAFAERAKCRTAAHRVRRKNPLQVCGGCGFKRYSLRGSVASRFAKQPGSSIRFQHPEGMISVCPVLACRG